MPVHSYVRIPNRDGDAVYGVRASAQRKVPLRAEADKDAAVLMQVPEDELVTETEHESHGFAQVQYNNYEGWIEKAYLQRRNSA